MEIGTLKELNVKPGDVVEWLGTFKRTKDFVAYKIGYAEGGVFRDSENGLALSPYGQWRIISRAPQSPVRTVTKKEIVPGVYGAVDVAKFSTGEMAAVMIAQTWTDINGDKSVSHACLTPDELRAAAETLIQIADALEA